MDDEDLYGDLDTSRNALKLKSVSVELISNSKCPNVRQHMII